MVGRVADWAIPGVASWGVDAELLGQRDLVDTQLEVILPDGCLCFIADTDVSVTQLDHRVDMPWNRIPSGSMSNRSAIPESILDTQNLTWVALVPADAFLDLFKPDA